MKFCSTRGGESGKSFSDVIIKGYAEDGGLYVPEEIPSISEETLAKWKTMSYPDLCAAILDLFDSDRLLGSIEQSRERFRNCYANFNHPEVLKVVEFPGDGTMIAELFHGPTLAFKDLALFGVAMIADELLKRRQRKCLAVVATSGDTGSSAARAVATMENGSIIVLFPKNFITKTQERQMTTISSENVHIVEGEGNSDELDVVLKDLTRDENLQQTHNIAIFNSINVARIVLQIPYFFYSYFRVIESKETGLDHAVTFVLPTGGGGNLAGGVFAKAMGLPIRFVICNNSNAAMHNIIQTSTLSKSADAADVQKTLACAMDIKVPYNLERVFYVLSKKDTKSVKEVMELFEAAENSFVATDEVILQTMKRCWVKNREIICPHTATAVAFYHHLLDNRVDFQQQFGSIVCVATASPAKFPEAVEKAKIDAKVSHPVIEALDNLPELNKTLMKRDENWLEFMKKFISKHNL
ncbi:unnamed protein product [Notodromas monacha]|uniref:Threonine synthase-like 2 n=1 Tax=Notodromas monacha TaxID=399045 RepID=A0A7R9BUA5_9CRUS|nr:unnamed protein product [Notodromas monacha]CAG0920811.1 unnamed protein product [Notodromas monacha]